MTKETIPTVPEISMTIGGRTVAAESRFEVLDPARDEVLATAPECSREQLDEAMAAAADAYPAWRRDPGARSEALIAAAAVLDAGADELARLITLEQGKPLADARREVDLAGVWLRYYAELELPIEVVQDDEAARVEVHRAPLGVVAAITPWNYPIVSAFWKLAPALRAGNTMVLKPSPYTPLSALRAGEMLVDTLPAGTFNVISGGDRLGEWMTSHPVPRKISFTGSVATGKAVAAAAAADLKRTTLELGGNDPAIVLPGSDPEAVATAMFWHAFRNAGQICTAIKRVYAPRAISEQLVEALARRAAAVRVGNGLDPETEMGPLNNSAQLDRVAELVDDARAAGASVAAGGERLDRPGYFYAPTVLAAAADSRIVAEEQFGPALPVVAYEEVEQAVGLANDTHFGLCGSVWSDDAAAAREVADRLECGTAYVNSHRATGPGQPFGGLKWSGLGVENGPWGLYGFTEIRVSYAAKA